jgi:hypothetical protein
MRIERLHGENFIFEYKVEVDGVCGYINFDAMLNLIFESIRFEKMGL